MIDLECCLIREKYVYLYRILKCFLFLSFYCRDRWIQSEKTFDVYESRFRISIKNASNEVVVKEHELYKSFLIYIFILQSKFIIYPCQRKDQENLIVIDFFPDQKLVKNAVSYSPIFRFWIS